MHFWSRPVLSSRHLTFRKFDDALVCRAIEKELSPSSTRQRRVSIQARAVDLGFFMQGRPSASTPMCFPNHSGVATCPVRRFITINLSTRLHFWTVSATVCVFSFLKMGPLEATQQVLCWLLENQTSVAPAYEQHHERLQTASCDTDPRYPASFTILLKKGRQQVLCKSEIYEVKLKHNMGKTYSKTQKCHTGPK